MKKILLFVGLCGCVISSLARQDTAYPKKVYVIAEIATPPQIDGWINDEAWDQVPWESNFQMFRPYDNRPPTQETQFKIVMDRENIYVAIRAFDSAPDSIVRRLTRRDHVDGDMVTFPV